METLNVMPQQQTTAILEINTDMNQISDMVQANSAISEESAASAQEMNAQPQMENDWDFCITLSQIR